MNSETYQVHYVCLLEYFQVHLCHFLNLNSFSSKGTMWTSELTVRIWNAWPRTRHKQVASSFSTEIGPLKWDPAPALPARSVLSIPSLEAQEAERCPPKAQERTAAWSCLLPQDTTRGWSATVLSRSQHVMDINEWTCNLAPIQLCGQVQRKLHAKPQSFWNDFRETSWFKYSLARIFQWFSELPHWTALPERQKGPCSWADCRSPAGGAAACWGGPSPAAVGKSTEWVSLTPDFHTEAPGFPSTFMIAHFLRREKKILTTEEMEVLSKATQVSLSI